MNKVESYFDAHVEAEWARLTDTDPLTWGSRYHFIYAGRKQ